jgi:hypothetical protein
MSYIEDGGFFSPVCKHFIELDAIRDATWLQCECGKWFNYSLLVDYESAKSRLEVATDDVEYLQAEVTRVSHQGQSAVLQRYIKSVLQSFRTAEAGAAPSSDTATQTTRTVAPVVSDSRYNAPAITITIKRTPEGTRPAQNQPPPTAYETPVPAQPKFPERPRGLAKSENRRQIGLFITAVTMVMVAFISYIAWGASLPKPIDPAVQVPIAALVVIGLGVVAVRTRQLSRVLSNVLAITSSVLALVSLWALAYYNVWGASADWVGSDWRRYPYIALIPFILGVLTLVPGYRFKLAGWLNPTAGLFAISGVIFNLTYQQVVLVGASEKLSLGWQLLTPSITAALVVIAGRFSRSKLDELPNADEVAKLVGAPEPDRRTYFELVDRHREQMLLNRINRSSLIGLLAVMAAHVFANVVGLTIGSKLDGAGLLVLGFVWLGITIAVETIGDAFTVSGTVAQSIKRGSWIMALGGIALGVATITLNSSATFDPANILVSGVLWLLGAVLVFLPQALPIARENKPFAFAANTTAFVVWGSWFVYALANNVFAAPAAFTASALFALLIAATLTAHNYVYRLVSLQLAAVLASSTGALLSLGGSRVAADGTVTITSNALAIFVALAVLNAFVIAHAVINHRAGAKESVIVRGISFTANIVAVFVASPAVLGNLSDAAGNRIDATQFWPVLLMLIVFAAGLLVVPNLGFATKDGSLLSARGRQTLIATSGLYLLAGFLYLATLSNNPHIFVTVTGYTFAVMLVVLSYGYIRRSVWAITASFGLSTIFSIGLGEAAMVYQNAGHQGDTIAWSVWYLVPFAALTYLHLLILRLRADTSVTFKVGLGVGGFAVTALAYEITRVANQQNTPAGSSASALNNYLTNRDVNVATLLGLGALALLLRLSPAVRKDVSRDLVLNFSGLLALALAFIDSFTTVADLSNVWAHYIALAVIGLLLLINSRTSFAVPQVIASFFVGQFLLIGALTWAAGLSNTSDQAGSIIRLACPYLAFLLTLVWFGAIQRLTPKADVGINLKTIVLTVSALVSAITLTLIGWPSNIVTGIGDTVTASSLGLPEAQIALAGATLIVLFVWRWVSRNSSLQLSVMVAGVIVWAAGSINALAAITGDTHLALWATILVIPASMLLIDSLVTRKALSTSIGLVPLLVSSWFFAAALIRDGHSEYALWQIVLPAISFGLATLVMRVIGSLRETPLWFAAIAPIVLVSAIAEFSTATSGLAQNSLDWPVTLALSLGMLALSQRITAKIPAVANTSMLASSGILWLTGFGLIWLTNDHTEILGGQNIDSLIYLSASTAVVFWHSLAAKNRTTLALGAVGSVFTGYAIDTVVHENWNWFSGPEVGALVASLGLTFAAYASRKVVGPAKSTLLTWGVPTAALLWPSVFYTIGSNQISQPWNTLAPEGVARLIALALVGTLVLLAGMRLANRGLVYASVATLMFEFVPALWFAIGNLFSDYGQSFVTELRGLLIAITIYVIQTILRRAVHLKINSLVIWGIPAIVSLAPTLIDVWAALGHHVETTDWVRFVVLVSVSTGFLVIGAIRKLSGLFYPGFIGVITAILPYAFSANAGGGLWIVGALVVLAALIIWVAVRIDRFTGWLKDLK